MSEYRYHTPEGGEVLVFRMRGEQYGVSARPNGQRSTGCACCGQRLAIAEPGFDNKLLIFRWERDRIVYLFCTETRADGDLKSRCFDRWREAYLQRQERIRRATPKEQADYGDPEDPRSLPFPLHPRPS